MTRSIPVFFYGLYMDADLLRQKGAHPADVRRAMVRGYAIRIGHRATLVPDEGIVYGVLVDLTHEDLERLYAEPSVQMYRPEPVSCELDGGRTLPALCFTLPQPPAPHEHNEGYARQLRELGTRLGLPADYVAAIE